MYRRERHSVTDIKVHLICVTKYRKSVFTEAGLNVVEDSFRSVAAKMNFVILEFSGEANHVHTLIEYPPKLSISQIANAVKGVSSRRYGQAGYTKPHPEALWSPSYFAVSAGGGACLTGEDSPLNTASPIEILKKYSFTKLR